MASPEIPDERQPESFAEAIARSEANRTPRDEYEFRGPLAVLRREYEARGEPVPPALIAEELAFSFTAHDRQGPSVWGLYFGPFMSWTTESGGRNDNPPLTMITPSILAYWRMRADTTTHPVMLARYADLLWELPKKLDAVGPDPAMARVAVRAYLTAALTGRYQHAVTALERTIRALDIAVSLKDSSLVNQAKGALLAIEDAVADDESLGLWGACLDTLLDPPTGIVVTDAEREKIVADLEARLVRLANPSRGMGSPMALEAAALRLARYHRRVGRSDDVTRVLTTYADGVRRLHGTTQPLVLGHWLERLHDQLIEFHQRVLADTLIELIRRVGSESNANMKSVEASVTIPQEKVEAFFNQLLRGPGPEALARIGTHFVPVRGEVERQLHEMAQQAPLFFLIARSIKDSEGRTVAHVGSLETDLEGNVVQQISQQIGMQAPWLREAIARGLENGLFTAASITDFLLESPVFQPTRRPILERGLNAYVLEDSTVSLHLLIPQIEEALRVLATVIGLPLYTSRRGGGFHLRTMDHLLRDPAIGEVLGPDVITYLRTLLTDARGWNVRNEVCHGTETSVQLGISAADRVVHALLVLAQVRANDATSEKPPL